MNRYNSYKDCGEKWLGEIPSHWKLIRSKYLWREKQNRSNSGKETLLSVSQYDGVTPSKDESRSESLEGYKVVNKNDLVINIMLAWLGGLGVSKYEGIVSPAYCIYSQKGDNCSQYLHYLYRTPTYLAEFARHSTGVVPSRWRMYTDDFGQVPTLLPPLNEQQAIASYLDSATSKIDAAIAREQKMIDLLNERKQIIINHAVTKGLNPNLKMRESGVEWISEIPVGWEILPLKSICKLGKGLQITKADLVEEGLPVVSYGQIHAKYNTRTHLSKNLIRYVPTSYAKGNDSCKVNSNEFVVADTSEDLEGCGNMVFNDSDQKIYAGYHTVIIKSLKYDYPKYLAYLFTSQGWRKQIRSLVNGVKVYSITQSILKRTDILRPSADEQKAIIAYLDEKTKAIDATIKERINMIALLQERKQIIINDVVTGKVKVN